jgi:hypothetical protein
MKEVLMSHVHQLTFPITLQPHFISLLPRRRDLQSLFNEFVAHVYRHLFLIDYFHCKEERREKMFVCERMFSDYDVLIDTGEMDVV